MKILYICIYEITIGMRILIQQSLTFMFLTILRIFLHLLFEGSVSIAQHLQYFGKTVTSRGRKYIFSYLSQFFFVAKRSFSCMPMS